MQSAIPNDPIELRGCLLQILWIIRDLTQAHILLLDESFVLLESLLACKLDQGAGSEVGNAGLEQHYPLDKAIEVATEDKSFKSIVVRVSKSEWQDAIGTPRTCLSWIFYSLDLKRLMEF